MASFTRVCGQESWQPLREIRIRQKAVPFLALLTASCDFCTLVTCQKHIALTHSQYPRYLTMQRDNLDSAYDPAQHLTGE